MTADILVTCIYAIYHLTDHKNCMSAFGHPQITSSFLTNIVCVEIINTYIASVSR